MGEQARGGAGDVGVGVQERLERLHEVGLVLLVVGHQRLDRLGVEAVQLGRVLAHRRQQQPVGARVLERQHRVLVAGLGDVGRQQRLVAGAVEVDRIGGQARVADREREAVQARAQLAHDGVGDAAHLGVVGGRQQHDDVAAVDHGGQRAGRAGAGGALGGGQHAAAPVLVGGRVVVRRGRRSARSRRRRRSPARRRAPRCRRGRSPRDAARRSGSRPARPRRPARAPARARPRTRSAS